MHFVSDDQKTLLGGRPTLQASRNTLLTAPYPTPTFLPALPNALQPRTTPSPTCCTPNQVIIELSTTVVIRDFQRFYSSDINSFSPTYFATADGSLITPVLTDDLWTANLDLLFTAALAMLFLRNIAVAIDFLRRSKNKNKILFHLLFTTQALAPASFVPSLLSFFNQFVNCTLVVTMSSTVGSVALAILLSGIIGFKTYRCMNDSKITACVIISLALGHLVIIVLDAITMQGARRISGSCLRISSLRYTRIAVALQMGECCFMMFCFVYTCIKYRKTPGARCRISLRMSMEESPLDVPGDVVREMALNGTQPMANEKVDAPTRLVTRAFPRSSAIQVSPSLPVFHADDSSVHARKSMASSLSRLSKLLSNMVNLKKVMRDELLYTCVITVVITLALVFTFTGVNVKNGLSVMNWISLTWGLVSVFVLHSSGRVVRRQEQDSFMRYAAARSPRATPPMPKSARANDCWVSPLSPDTRNQRDSWLSKNTDLSNPFSETHQLREDRRQSYQSASMTASSLGTPLSPEVAVTDLSDSVALPLSARDSGFPASGRHTPIVLPGQAEGALQGLQPSWHLRRSTEA